MGRKQSCMICLETFSEGDIENNFPHKCLRCSSGNVCAGCLRQWFLDACRNESKMPPKCCSIIPLSTVSGLLKTHEVRFLPFTLYERLTRCRLNFIRRNTRSGVPLIDFTVPSYHAQLFIPPRLLIEIATAIQTSSPSNKENEGRLAQNAHIAQIGQPSPSADAIFATTDDVTTFRTEWAKTSSFTPQQAKVKSNVTCLSCATSICTRCHSFTHIGPCAESDIDPELAASLKKWKIKRCPKCRTGVRKMFGCAHIQCRCGAHFCWECLLPITICDGGCEDDP